LKASQRRHYDLKNAAIECELVLVSDIPPAWRRVVKQTTDALFAIPRTLRKLLPHLTATDEKTIDRLIRDSVKMAGMTNTPPPLEIQD
jgi:phage terminase Nu1 subunit (DNA packaging protein)